MPIEKGRVLLQELDPLHSSSPKQLLEHPLLTEAERRRAHNARLDARCDHIGLLLRRDYPEAIVYDDSMPPALFVDGDSSVLHLPTIAIVGTRTASAYGRACAMKFAEAFARAGVVVVSGGAVGIDAAAHGAALDTGGQTVAVLAGGVDQRYPSVNFGLFERIRANGCMISQFALGSKPDQYKFIVRNRLIAALSQAVLVIEAPAKSGALHTSVAAAELGREVFVVPAAIDFMSFRGSLALIRDGATLAFHPDQVLEPLGIRPVAAAKKTGPKTNSASGRILDVLTPHAVPVERIVELTGMDASEVLGELTMLELEGAVFREAGGFAKKL